MRIEKGKTATVRARFSSGGSPATFNQPPRWTVYTANGTELLSGVAVPEGGEWVANFTISQNYVIPGGTETLTIQFLGRDARNHSYTKDVDMQLGDTTEEYKTDVVLYNRMLQEPLTDTLTVPTPLVSLTATLIAPNEVVVATDQTSPPNLIGRYSGGYEYAVDLGLPVMPDYNYVDPYQLVLRAVDEAGRTSNTVHMTYVVTYQIATLVNSLQMYLDKAHLQEIDPTLQWHYEELVHYVIEGIKYVNGALPRVTWWTAVNFPSSLHTYLMAASALAALRARHLAEGLNAFSFQGSNTALDFNRTDVLQQHIDAWQTLLEGLPAAKGNVIRTVGEGTPPPGTASERLSNIGVFGGSRNLLNNGMYRRNRGPSMFR